MLLGVLLVLHIAVLGYWLGSEFVINSTYRYVSYSAEMPFSERSRLLQHVMVVDQHVRYALVLQFTLGFMLVVLLGYIPGGNTLVITVFVTGLLWLVLVETTHRYRNSVYGKPLATLDRAIRYCLMIGLVVFSLMTFFGHTLLPGWLAIKLALFAAVMACGVGIRLVLVRLFRIWHQLDIKGSDAESETLVRQIYVQATSILILLWVFITIMVTLSIWKP